MALFFRKSDGVVFLRLSNGIHGPVLRTASSGAPWLVAAAVDAYKGAARKTDSVSEKAKQRLASTKEHKTEAEAQLAAEKVPDRTCVAPVVVFQWSCACCFACVSSTCGVFHARRRGMQARVIDVTQSPAAVDAATQAKDQRLAQLTQKIAGAEARISKFAEHNTDRVNEVRRFDRRARSEVRLQGH
jgi:hypothetical protein